MHRRIGFASGLFYVQESYTVVHIMNTRTIAICLQNLGYIGTKATTGPEEP